MTRDNLMAIVDKFQLFPNQRNLMSVTQLVDLMKKKDHHRDGQSADFVFETFGQPDDRFYCRI